MHVSPQSSENQFVFQRRNRLKQHFVNTSKVLLYSYKSLSDGAKITYQLIDGYDWEDKETGDSKGYVYPAVETLAAIRGLSKRTIERHISELESVKLLTRQQRRNLPSILVIEDVSDEESKAYLQHVHKGDASVVSSSTTFQPVQTKPQERTHKVSPSFLSETTKTTNDKNSVSGEGRGTTEMSFAYMDEKRRSEEQQQAVVAELGEFKIGKRKSQQLVVQYSSAYITQKIDLLKWKLSRKTRGQPIVDTAAWLIRAIEEDYPLPDALSQQHKAHKKVIDVNEQEGVYTVLEGPMDVVIDS